MINLFNSIINRKGLRNSAIANKSDSTKYVAKEIQKNTNAYVSEGYGNGFVLFLDILGFKDIVSKSEHNDAKMRRIVGIFDSINKQYKSKKWGGGYIFPITKGDLTIDKYLPETSMSVSMSLFSDSIIITYRPEIKPRFVEWYEQLHQIFNDICKIMYLFAENDIFMRGGLSYGLVYHEGNCCYGPALEQACLMEEKIVYPTIGLCEPVRLMIISDLQSKEIDDFAPGYKTPYELRNFARDFFAIFCDSLIIKNGENKETFSYVDWLSAGFFYNMSCLHQVRNHIEHHYREKNVERVREKYKWLKEAFNRATYAPKALGKDADYSKLVIED